MFYVCDSLDQLPAFARKTVTTAPLDNQTLYIYGDEQYFVWAYASLSMKPGFVEDTLRNSYEEGPREPRHTTIKRRN